MKPSLTSTFTESLQKEVLILIETSVCLISRAPCSDTLLVGSCIWSSLIYRKDSSDLYWPLTTLTVRYYRLLELSKNVSFKLINLKYFTILRSFFSGALHVDVLKQQQEKEQTSRKQFSVTVPLTQGVLLWKWNGSCQIPALEGMSWVAESALHNCNGYMTQSLSDLLAISIIHCSSFPTTSFIFVPVHNCRWVAAKSHKTQLSKEPFMQCQTTEL